MLVLESECGPFYFVEIRATKRSIGAYFDRGNVHHDAMEFIVECVWQIRRLYESSDARSFSRKRFSCSALGKPQALSQEVMLQPENVDQIWSQFRSRVLKSGIMSFIVPKTRGIFLQGCSSSRKRSGISCKMILHLRF